MELERAIKIVEMLTLEEKLRLNTFLKMLEENREQRAVANDD